ncbi:MAG: hypothetical protein SO181_12635 [Frisingicoccus sp.]|uniref:hypothetical protein n=1 Tax=Frisingicoccus sp. TaxID=1918627 RepID=UPI002A820246|nr:hypothetical protein [Frisingicoccus sp.]MDY4835955.1 hypothetical protein [Frisingicoccus sp.]
MRYYARYENGVLYSVGIGLDGMEITKEEYENLSNEIREKATFVNQLYYGEITIGNVPSEWQDEIQRRVDERVAAEGEASEQDIPAEEALAIILGGEI